MAVVSRGFDADTEGGLIGLKIDVSPELLPPGNDAASLKIFTLIPPFVRTVRELKSHLSSVVLKTHIPFYFYNGDFRIPDEDDVRIFTLMDEPCRLIPVPQRRSVLSISDGGSPSTLHSTPLSNTSSSKGHKRVKFNDVISSSGIITHPSSSNSTSSCGLFSPESFDQIDNIQTHVFPSTKANGSCPVNPSSPNPIKKRSLTDDSELSGTEILEIRKAKRKRRRRQHNKDKTSNADKLGVDSLEIEGSSSQLLGTVRKNKKEKTHSIVPMQLNSDDEIGSGSSSLNSNRSKKRKAKVLSNYDADESSEFGPPNKTPGNSVKNKKDVINSNHLSSHSSVTASNGQKMDLLNGNTSRPKQGGSKQGFLTPSSIIPTRQFHSSSINNSSEFDSPAASKISGTGKRQDTPMLPRVLKNPEFNFDSVRKSLSSKLDLALENQVGQTENDSAFKTDTSGLISKIFSPSFESSCTDTGEENQVNVFDAADEKLKEENQQYLKLSDIKTPEQISVGNVIAFKIVELDENYTPAVSSYKEAIVLAKNGELLSLKCIKNDIKTRSGAFEIKDSELQTEQLDDLSHTNFRDLFELKLLSANP